MKVGRNDRCPCGSGKKYKVCCGAAPETESSDTLAWRRLSRAIENHTAKLFSFIEETYGPEAIPEAWEEFTLWSEEPFTPDDPQVTLFYPWLFHHWSPDPADTAVEARCLHEISPTQAYLIARGQDLDVALYRYLSACLDSPFGFYEVVGVEPGSGLRLREILTETLHHVRERSAFGQSIGSFQASRFTLAEVRAEVEIGRVYVDRCARALNTGELTPEDAATAKWLCTVMQGRVVDRCLQLHGGYGYMLDYPIARAYADARVTRIYGGANEIMKEIVGRSMGL